MYPRPQYQLEHTHEFYIPDQRAVSRTRWVALLTLVMMVFEIISGMATGSMALLADGWHMGTHAGALGIAVFAYYFTRRHARSPRFTFGTGKVGILGAFASAIVLAIVAVLMLVESGQRLWGWRHLTIQFNEALLVACIGLAVNLVSAWLLSVGGGRGHENGHNHDHGHEHSGHSHEHRGHAPSHPHADHNLRAAYLHVLADAMTSVLAIVALLAGKSMGWVWMDPAMGIVGAMVIAKWSQGLLRDTARILLDADVSPETVAEIRRRVEADGDNHIADLHIWKVGPVNKAALLCVTTSAGRGPDHFKAMLADLNEIRHITVEVHAVAAQERGGIFP